MYRQLTLAGILSSNVTAAQRAAGYDDVLAAWRTYLKRYNKGRGVVLLGHSQGSFVLRQLIAKEIDTNAAVRRRIVSAVLLGGNVTVKKGKDRGGDFKHVRACRSRTQIGCVVAFSTFNETPPAGALFGSTSAAGLEVLCTNPAALGGGSANLDGIYPSAPFAPGTVLGMLTAQIGLPVPDLKAAWIQARGAYSGHCSSTGGANVLRVNPAPGAPTLRPLPAATWGLHLADANIALGDLVDLVRRQGNRYAAARR